MSVRFARRRSRLLFAATAVLAATMPLVAGTSAAWASGGGTAVGALATPVASSPAAAVHQGTPQIAFLPGVPGTITAGGAPIEFGAEMGNFTGAAYDHLQPTLGFDNLAAGSHPGGGSNLRPEDFTVQVMTGGQWKTLAVQHSSDPVIITDTSSLAQPLDNGRAVRMLFRVSLSAKAPADQQDITVYLGTSPNSPVAARSVHIVRSTAPSSAPAGAQTGTPTESAAPPAAPTAPPTTRLPAPPTVTPTVPAALPAVATEPAAVLTSPAAVPTTTASAGQQLASTGGGDSSGLLLGIGSALVVLGAGAVILAVRRRSGIRH